MQKRIGRWFTGAALAAALLVAAPHKAEAQVGFGVQVGGYPAYGYGYFAHQQWEAARAAEWRHEQWERQRFWEHRWDYGWRGYPESHGWR